MNILPFVFAFVLIFALGASTLLQNWKGVQSEEIKYRGFMRTHRELQSSIERKQFVYQRGKVIGTAPKEKKEGEKVPTYYNPREALTLHPLSKLNIAPLLSKSPFPASALLYETAATLIRLLYEKTPFYKKDLEYQLLDQLISSASQIEGEISWGKLIPLLVAEEPYYKIFRGTKSYQLFTNKGYPPLSDFISLDAKKKLKPLHLRYATKPLLISLFGEKLTLQIEEIEREKWKKDYRHHSITSEELGALLLKDHTNRRNLMDFEPLMNFSVKTERNPNLTIVDGSSGITLRKP